MAIGFAGWKVGVVGALLAGALALSSGCVGLSRNDVRSRLEQEPDAGRNRVVVQGPRITAESLASVDIVNPAGPVRVIVDPSLRRPVVEANPIPMGSVDRATMTRLRDSLTISAESYLDDVRTVLRVRVAYQDPAEEARIGLIVYTPSCGGVMVRNAAGPVELVGVSGDMNVHSGAMGEAPGGDIVVVTDQPVHGPLKIATTDGSIDLTVPTRSSGDFELSSLDGRVQVQLKGARTADVKAGERRWTGTINDGRHLCVLETVKGNVRLRTVNYPVEHTARFGMTP